MIEAFRLQIMMVRLDNISVQYPNGVTALRNCTAEFKSGEFIVLLGQSGAGKSTLLRCLNGLVRPSKGRVVTASFGDIAEGNALQAHRRRTGMVFQNHHLIGRLSVLDNVLTGRLGHHTAWRTLLPLPRRDQQIALRAIERVGLLEKALTRVDELSGGQQQRVGVARALCQQPDLILADEPVASLDPATAAQVLESLRQICATDGITAIVSLHQVDLARRFADQIVGMADGAIVARATASQLSPRMIDDIYRAGPQAGPERPDKRQATPDAPETSEQHAAMEALL